MIGKLKESLPLSGGEWLVSFTTRDNPGQIFDDLKGEAVKVEIRKASKAKSRDANAYCWVIIDKIAEGAVAKYCKEVCLMEQAYIRDDKMTINDLCKAAAKAAGMNVTVSKFVRIQLGA